MPTTRRSRPFSSTSLAPALLLLLEETADEIRGPPLHLVRDRPLRGGGDVDEDARPIERTTHRRRQDDPAVLLRVTAQIGSRLRREFRREREIRAGIDGPG